MTALREALQRTLAATLDRLRKRGRGAAWRVARLTGAAVASFVVAKLVFPQSAPLLAPLTALLVIQLTPVSILVSGVQRVVSVVVGVTVAVGLSSTVHITWWSLGAVIAISLVIGQVLRLGSNLLEVPISAMLVLGVGSRTADSAAWQRIAETLVGAGVGVLSNLVFPPKVTSKDAAAAISHLADDLARVLDVAADEVTGDELTTEELRERSTRWLGDIRRVTHNIPNAGTALIHAEESRRLNLRALGTANSGPGLRQGLESLEHSALALRSMCRSFVEAAEAYADDGREFSPEIRTALSRLLHNLAAAVRSFGRLVNADAGPGEHPAELAALQEDLVRLREAHERVLDRLPLDPRHDPTLAVLTVSVLSTTRRLLNELDLDERSRVAARPPPILSTQPWRRRGGFRPSRSGRSAPPE